MKNVDYRTAKSSKKRRPYKKGEGGFKEQKEQERDSRERGTCIIVVELGLGFFLFILSHEVIVERNTDVLSSNSSTVKDVSHDSCIVGSLRSSSPRRPHHSSHLLMNPLFSLVDFS